MSDTKTYTQFAQEIKAKYPEYQQVDDKELAQKMVDKFPQYKNIVKFEEPSPIESAKPISTPTTFSNEDATRTIYGNVPGQTKFKTGAAPISTIGMDVAMAKKFGKYKDSSIQSVVAVPQQSVFNEMPQMKIRTIEGMDAPTMEDERNSILLPPEAIDELNKIKAPGKFDREQERAIKDYQAKQREQELRDYYAFDPEGKSKYKAHTDFINRAEENITRADQDLHLREKAFNDKRSKLYSPFYSGSEEEYAQNDREKLVLDAERTKLNDARNAISAYKEGKSDNSVLQFLGQMKRGAGSTVEDIASWGMSSLLNDMSVNAAQIKYASGKRLTPDESKLLNTAALSQYVTDTMGANRTFAQDLASGIEQSLPYMATFMTTGGIAKGITGGLAKGSIKEAGIAGVRGIEGGITKGLARTLGVANHIADAGLQAGIITILDPKTYDAAVKNINGQSGYEVDPKTNRIQYTGRIGGMDFNTAVTNAITSSLIENASEFAGEAFEPLGEAVKRFTKTKLPGVAKMIYGNNKFFNGVENLMEKAKWNGMLGEFMEDQLATIGHSLAGDGQGQWSDLTDARNQALTLANVMAIGSGAWMANTAGNQIAKYQMSKQYNKAEQTFDNVMGADGISLKNVFVNGSIEDKNALMEFIMNDEQIPNEQKQATWDYFVAGTRWGSFNAAINDIIAKTVNDKTGTVVTGMIRGEESPIKIISGLALTTNENNELVPDEENSDESIYYKDADGKVHPTTIDNLTQLTETSPEEVQLSIHNEYMQAGITDEMTQTRPFNAYTDEELQQAMEDADTLMNSGMLNEQQLQQLQAQQANMQAEAEIRQQEVGSGESVVGSEQPVVSSGKSVMSNGEPVVGNETSPLTPLSSENVTEEQPVVGSAESVVSSEQPQYQVLPNGTPDFANMDEQQTYNYIRDTENEDEARSSVERDIMRAQKAIQENDNKVREHQKETFKLLSKAKSIQHEAQIKAEQARKKQKLDEERKVMDERLGRLKNIISTPLNDRVSAPLDDQSVNAPKSPEADLNNPQNDEVSMTDSEKLDAEIMAQNPNMNPTDKQKESGNYDKARVNVQGFNITVENPRGSVRSGVDPDGKAWSITMQNHYGELDGTEGYDGDPIDVFIGANPNEGGIWVIDQQTPTPSGTSLQEGEIIEQGHVQKFDESKVMIGFDSAEEAKAAYMSNYEPGWTGFGAITPAGENFKKWLYDGKKQRKAYSEYAEVRSQKSEVRSEEPKRVINPFQRRINRLGDYVSLEDYVLRSIAGGTKFVWETTGSNKGLGEELGFNGTNNTEKKLRKSILSPDGITPQEMAHQIWQDHAETGDNIIPGINGMSSQDIANTVLEVLNSVHTQTEAMQAAETLQPNEPETFGFDKDEVIQFMELPMSEAEMRIIEQIPDDILASFLGIDNFTPEQLTTLDTLFTGYSDQIQNDYDIEQTTESTSTETSPDTTTQSPTEGSTEERPVNAETEVEKENPDQLPDVGKMIENPSESENVQFQAIENENKLVVLHNISASGLKNADKLGALPMPSLAVTKAELPLTGYGEITLIGDKRMVDPLRGTRTFGADIYSARYPELSYTISKQGEKVIQKAVEILPVELQGDVWHGIEQASNNGLKGILDSNSLKTLWLTEQGKLNDILEKEQSEYSKETVDAISKIDGYDYLDVMNNPEARQQITDIFFAEKPTLEKFREKFTDENGMLNENSSRQLFDGVKRYLRVSNRIDRINTYRNASNYIVKNNMESEWRKYATDLYEKLGVKEQIFKGYTNSGFRKYVDHTIENVMKAMKTKNLRGAEQFFYGAGSVRARIAPEFKSISDIKANSEKLTDKESFEKVKTEIDEKLTELQETLDPFFKSKGSYRGSFTESLADEIVTLANKGQSESFDKLSKEARTQLVQFIEMLKNAPTEYFEAKPTREVYLSEFTAAVVPEDTDTKTLEILENSGIKVERYSDNRAEVVRRVSEEQNVQFQKLHTGATLTPTTPEEVADTVEQLMKTGLAKEVRMVTPEEIQGILDGTEQKQILSDEDVKKLSTSEKTKLKIDFLRNIDVIKTDETRTDEDYEPDEAEYTQQKVYIPVYVNSWEYDENSNPDIEEFSDIDEALEDLETPGDYDEVDEYFKPTKRLNLSIKEAWIDKNGNIVEESDDLQNIDDTEDIPEEFKNILSKYTGQYDSIGYIDDKTFEGREDSARELENEVYFNINKDIIPEYDGYKISSTNSGKYRTIIVEKGEESDTIQLRIADHSYNPNNNDLDARSGKFISIEIANVNPTKGRFNGKYGIQFDGEDTYEDVVEELNDRIKEIIDNHISVQFLRTPSGTIYGFVKGGIVYLNSETPNLNTPIHEFGHLWVDAIEGSELYTRGAALVRETPYWERVNSDPNYKDLSETSREKEAMAMAIGDKGEAVKQNLGLFARIKVWINDVWKRIGSKFGIQNLTPAQIQNLTWNDFVDVAVSELFTPSPSGIPLKKGKAGKLTETIEVDGVQRPTMNSNGKPIHSTEAGIRNFWKWFGDSKVVDEQGRPLVVYHGTMSNFNEFKRHSTEEPTFWFTQDISRAKSFGGIKSVYIKSNSPAFKDVMPNMPSSWGGHDSYISYVDSNPILSKIARINIERKGGDPEKVLKDMPKKGDIFSIVISNPTQIKSATGNDGSFDPNEPDIRYQIIGEQGATALDAADAAASSVNEATTRLDNLAIAKKIEATKTPQEIRLATGWEKGVDGLWRYEVPDIELSDDILEAYGEDRIPTTGAFLRFAIKDNGLFNAYPELLKTRIEMYPGLKGESNGSYQKGRDTIVINSLLPKEQLQSTLIHEIQHAIQDIEGFAKGGSVNSFPIEKMGSEMAIRKLKKQMNDFEKTEIGKQIQKEDDLFDEKFPNPKDATEQDYQEYEQYLRNKYPEYKKIQEETATLLNFHQKVPKTKEEGYHRLSGETEARNASARMNFTPEERLQRLLSETADVAPADQIVLMNGMGVSNSESEAEKPKYEAGTPLEKYANEITAYNNRLKEIKRLKAELNKNYENKQIKPADFSAETKKLNDEKQQVENKVKRVLAGTSTPAELEGLKPDFKDYNGDLIRFNSDLLEWNKRNAVQQPEATTETPSQPKNMQEAFLAKRNNAKDYAARKIELLAHEANKPIDLSLTALNTPENIAHNLTVAKQQLAAGSDAQSVHENTGWLNNNGTWTFTKYDLHENELPLYERNFYEGMDQYIQKEGNEGSMQSNVEKYVTHINAKAREKAVQIESERLDTQTAEQAPEYDADKEAERLAQTIGSIDELNEMERQEQQDIQQLASDNQDITELMKQLAERRKQKGNKLKNKIQDVSQQVSDYIRTAVGKDIVDVMSEREFKSLIDKLEKATSAGNLRTAMKAVNQAIQQIVLRKNRSILKGFVNGKIINTFYLYELDAAVRTNNQITPEYANLIDNDLMNTLSNLNSYNRYFEIQGKNKAGVSIAKNVDEGTRQIMQFVRDYKDLSREQLLTMENELNEQRNELNARNTEEITDEVRKQTNKELLRNERKQIALEQLKRLSDIKDVEADIQVLKNTDWQDEAFQGPKAKWEVILERQKDLEKLQMASIRDFATLLDTGRNLLSQWKEAEQAHNDAIAAEALAAVTDKTVKTQGEEKANPTIKKRNLLSTWWRTPYTSFEFVLSNMDRNHPNGEGPMYRRWMPALLKASDQFNNGYNQFRSGIDKAVSDIIGTSLKEFTKDTRTDSGMSIAYSITLPDGTKQTENIPMTKGELIYVWLTWQHADGHEKLEAMDITQDDIDTIAETLGDQYIEFARWTQDYLDQNWQRYNETHIAVFGTIMGKIKNYFPLKYAEIDLTPQSTVDEINPQLPSIMEGAIINRVRTKKHIKLNENFLDTLMEHGENMERWNAYAKLRKDLNALLKNKEFRNRMKANSTGIFEDFVNAAKIAVVANQPNPTDAESMYMNFVRNLQGAAIAGKLNTALKQSTAVASYVFYKANPEYYAYLAKNMKDAVQATKTIQWAKKNLPTYAERLGLGNFGNEKLLVDKWENSLQASGKTRITGKVGRAIDKTSQAVTEIGMAPNKWVDGYIFAVGSHAIYEYEKQRYQKAGYSETEAEQRALFDAANYSNKVSQSSNPAYLAPIQKSKTFWAQMFTVFLNANFAFGRNTYEATVQLLRSGKQVRTLTSENEVSGMSEEEAKAAAQKTVLNANGQAILKIIYSGFIANFIFQMFDSIFSRMMGGGGEDDDDEKWKKIIDAAWKSPLNNVLGGGNIIATIEGFQPQSLLDSETSKAVQELKNSVKDGFSTETARLAVEYSIKFGLGLNLETLTNIYMGIEKGIVEKGGSVMAYQYITNVPKSVRTQTAVGKLEPGESLIDYANRVKLAHDRKLRADEEKELILKKVYSDKGDMTRFNRAVKLADEWNKLQTKEYNNETKSDRYKELEKLDKDYVLTDIHNYVENAVKWYRIDIKNNKEPLPSVIQQDKESVYAKIEKLEEMQK